MGNHHDSIALDWVRGEIQETLTQGQQALEAFVDNRDDTARLRFCLNYLHQVHGTLQMVELFGAALLTEEMEKLTLAILNDTVVSVDEAVEVLMDAILQLPQYLEHLGSSKDDFPLVLLPLLNDLRAARGDALLSDTSLFKPDLQPIQAKATGSASARLRDPKVQGHLRKLRQMYQFALVGIVREENLRSHFDYLQKVIERLIKLCQNTPRAELWKAAGGFVETLQSGDNPVNTAVKSILRNLDIELRRLVDEHIDILQQPVPVALFKHLLYYVARARALDTPYVKDLRERYRLDDALPSDAEITAARTRVSGPGREAIHSVVLALNEELSKLKDQLDLFVRAQFRNNDDLGEMLPGLNQVANTLTVLGLGIPRRVITEQIEIIDRLSGQIEAIDDNTLMDVAGALLYVESSLTGLDNDQQLPADEDQDSLDNYGSRELDEANAALLRESRNTLEQVKTAIINFIASQWDSREIEHVPGLIYSIRGGLSLIPLPRISDMLESCERYVSDVLLTGKHVPDWQQLDTLADAVTSIEYYLERLIDGITDNENILRIAEQSLETLGFPTGVASTWLPPEAISQQTVEATPAHTVDKGSDTDLLDDEILGIFVEEAEEVLATIQQYYPVLRQSHDNHEALSEVRRAYHTLKGSGRLVGASSLAELAWSVESLLNRVIDRSIKPADELFTLVDSVNERLPELIEQFRHGQSDGDVAALIARVDAMSTTRKVNAETEIDVEESAPVEPEAPTAVTATDDSDDLIDDEILEIFVEEAGEVLETIAEYLPMLLRQHDDRSALGEIRRAFHTLKGSGRIVGAHTIGELAWSIENMLNRMIDGGVFMNTDIADLLVQTAEIMPDLVADFEAKRPASHDTEALEALARALADGEIPNTRSMPAAEIEADAPPILDSIVLTEEGSDQEYVDPVLLDIFESETRAHLHTLQEFLDNAGDKSSVNYNDNVSRALHTLKGSAHTAAIAPIARVITPLEHYVKDARTLNLRADRDVLELIGEASQFVTQGLEQIRRCPQSDLAGTDAFLEKLNAVSVKTLGSHTDSEFQATGSKADPQLVQLFLSEGLDVLLDAEVLLNQWAIEPLQTSPLDTLVHELQQLATAAQQAKLEDIAELSSALAASYQTQIWHKGEPSEAFLSVARDAHENLINMMDQVAAGLATMLDASLINELEYLLSNRVSAEEPERLAPAQVDALDTEFDDMDRTLDIDLGLVESPEEDFELAEIFLDEAQDLVASTAESLQAWSAQPDNDDLLLDLQRGVHTLKGGARLVNIGPIGDLTHELENLFEGLTESRLFVTEDLSDLLFRCHDRLAGMVEALSTQSTLRPAPDLIGDIQAYMSSAQNKPTTPTLTEELPDSTPTTALDPELAEIFLEEATEIIGTTADLLHEWRINPEQPALVTELQRELHTLKGGARMVDIAAIADIAHEMETLFERIADGRIVATEARTNLAVKAHDQLAAFVDAVAATGHCASDPDLVSELQAAVSDDDSLPATPTLTALDRGVELALHTDEADAVHSELLEIFLGEARDISQAIAEHLVRWREGDAVLAEVSGIQQELHTLTGGARLSDLDLIADLADTWQESLDSLQSNPGAQKVLLTLSQQASTALKGMLDCLESGQPLVPEATLIAAFNAATSEIATAQDPAEAAIDLEVIEIFNEEARELVDELEQLFTDWQAAPTNPNFNREAQRVLHTLKGGARLSQLTELGDLAHDLESRLVQSEGQALDDAAWQTITADYDQLNAQVVAVRKRFDEQTKGVAAIAPATPMPVAEAPESKPAPETAEPQTRAIKKRAESDRRAPTSRPVQDSVRVSAPLLDDLVNLAGETSITRGRLEQQTSDFSHTLDEMASTIERLREQLRRMDIETEAQILFRAEREHGPDYGDDFDPLEMDRYSSIQQLSRALSESSSDLADLRSTLAERLKDTETLLVQQSRINTELQEGLMKTRMIPFASMLPRLRRIVRQISSELGKKANFDVRNAEGEMDRNILERMIAPMEHMLRNALDHGIETPDARVKAGKPETGDITLSLTREGGDVVLRMMDDGAGIPVQVIRDKAVRLGMMRADDDLSDRDILQFILQPGFSTAQTVTQISGRGVGMDVVASEIKQLGGSLDIESHYGSGTTFIVRLPFTVSVNRALMVSTGEDFYAIPLNTIEGIVRVSTYELEEYYKPDAPMYEYAGQQYRLQYLGGLLNSDHHPKLQGQALPLPVILVRGAEQPMALQVDNIMGSREIVVKSLGPQFSTVRGVSGATILGDGNVVVILDLPAMIRSDILSERERHSQLLASHEARRLEARPTMVMVVDDSVTVRKVTSRLLERNGMEVVTAKDGLDAVAQLQDHKPDIILLDIEMPRMDGFEVASFVRHDSDLRDIPICMITSRTGEKHRERALAIGVNEYLGKPFQETELLATIERLTGDQ